MAARASAPVVRDDRVLPFTSAVSIVIIPFLVLTFAVLFFWPRDTGLLTP